MIMSGNSTTNRKKGYYRDAHKEKKRAEQRGVNKRKGKKRKQAANRS
jgi:hypothetical protein